MKKLIFLCCTLLNLNCTIKQNEVEKTFVFGHLSVETGHCKNASSIRITENSKQIYYDCSGEGMGYYNIDTVTMNGDGVQDFIYCYQMEEYTVLGLLVSVADKTRYKQVSIAYLFSPETYGDLKTDQGMILKDYIFIDIDKDGRRDLLTNVITKGKEFSTIQNFTDTISFNELKERAEGSIKTPRSRGVFLSKPE